MSENKEVVKSCRTCYYRNGDWCEHTDTYYSVRRIFPNTACNAEYSGWVPRQSFWSKIFWFVSREKS